MNEYVKPDFEVMVFEPNEYVAACPWENGTDLTIGCGDGKVDIELSGKDQGVINAAAGIYKWTATYKNEYNNDMQAMLYPVFKRNESKYVDYSTDGKDLWEEFTFQGYGYAGNISVDHTDTTKPGEVTGLSASSGSTADDYFLAGGYNDQNGATGFSWVGAAFHFLTYIKNKNLS